MWKMKHWEDLSTPLLPGPLQFPLKVVMSESDKEEEEEQDVDPLIKLVQMLMLMFLLVLIFLLVPLSYYMSAVVFPLVFLLGTLLLQVQQVLNLYHGSRPLLSKELHLCRWKKTRLGEEAQKDYLKKSHAALERLRSEYYANPELEHDVSKKPKPTEVPMSSQPDIPQQQATNVPPVDPQQPYESLSQPNVSMSSGPEKKGHTYGTRRKSLGTMKESPHCALTWNAEDKIIPQISFCDDSEIMMILLLFVCFCYMCMLSYPLSVQTYEEDVAAQIEIEIDVVGID
ncbi:hypothetical protein Tco_0413167 [Tanacetum coccineum]